MEQIEFDGRVFKRWTNCDYFRRGLGAGGVEYLHRAVWEKANGPIPEGHHIHHKDEDRSNNDPANLECLSPAEHFARHLTDERREAMRRNLAENARPKASAWHKDPANREHHVRIGGMAYKNFVPEPKPCEHCGVAFEPKSLGNRDRFCSNACKSAWRRASGVDDVERACVICSTPFTTNKYSKVKTCNLSCRSTLIYRNRKA